MRVLVLGDAGNRRARFALAADGALVLAAEDGSLIPIHSGEVSFAELEALRRKHA